jgi:hypothetical protein
MPQSKIYIFEQSPLCSRVSSVLEKYPDYYFGFCLFINNIFLIKSTMINLFTQCREKIFHFIVYTKAYFKYARLTNTIL